jgi:hypothetical protein
MGGNIYVYVHLEILDNLFDLMDALKCYDMLFKI